MDDALHLLGLLHPLLLHAPLGALLALAALELWSAVRKHAFESRRPLAVITALTAAVAAGSGWLLAADGYGGDTLFRHRWGGVTLAVLLCLTAICARAERTRPYLAGLLLALVASGLTGHWGATLTHGPGYFRLDEPAPAPAAPPGGASAPAAAAAGPGPGADPDPGPGPGPADQPPPAAGLSYTEQIAPVLGASCVVCHGPAKQKAKLALHTPQAIAAGGFTGPVIAPGDPAGSELLRRMRLPLDDDEHMPPENKPQPSAEQIELLERWISAGAPGLELPAPEPAAEEAGAAAPAGEAEPAALEEARLGPQPVPPAAAEPLTPADPDAVARLQTGRVHVEALDADGRLLWVDCAGRPDADDALLTTWLSGLSGHIVELSLAGTAVSDAGVALVADMPRLERLDLSRTGVTSKGLAALAGHARLQVLSIAGTAVDDRGLAVELPALRRLFAHGSAVTPAGLERLAATRPDLELVFGEPREALETEPPPVFGDPDAPRPANTTCPVSAQPVDPRFAVVWQGEVIGFCCAECPSTFWKDPAGYSIP